MIDGSSAETGWRLTVTKHPDLPSAKRGKETAVLDSAKRLKIAKFLVSSGALEKGKFDAAVAAARAEFGRGDTVIKACWRTWKPVLTRRDLALRELRAGGIRNCPGNSEPQSG